MAIQIASTPFNGVYLQVEVQTHKTTSLVLSVHALTTMCIEDITLPSLSLITTIAG